MTETHPVSELPSVGTLSDDFGGLTCSIVVARARYGEQHVVGFRSFEDASTGVLDGQVESFLVPGAYPRIREFIMHPALRPKECFIAPIVPLVVAIQEDGNPEYARTIYLHRATESLLKEVKIKYESQVFSASNPEACLDALSADSCATLTNMPAALHFGLKIIQEMRHAVNMPWVLFSKEFSSL